MSEARYHPLEAILRMCAHATPEPWHYRVYAKETGTDPEQIVGLLEMLWLEGLVEKAPGSAEAGPGVTVTELGRQVADDPDALRRLCAGEPIRSGDVGSIVRQSLRKRKRPIATQLIVAANLLVFAIGGLLAAQKPGLLSTYMVGLIVPAGQAGALSELWHRLGSVSVVDLVHGQWWRLITATFVHAGLLHVGMNMYGMWVVGRFVEQTWGSWRLLAIYFIGAWGGSCLAMSYSSGLVGASGAVCGVLGAEGMWILLYGRYLPRNMARAGRTQMVTSIVLIVFISLLPNVSWQGHLGGGLTGAAAALVLHFQRFGPAVFRVLGVIALLVIPWGSYAWMERGRATSGLWQRTEKEAFLNEDARPVTRTVAQTLKVGQDQLNPLLNQHAGRRDAQKVEEALNALEERKQALDLALKRLASRRYALKELNAARETADVVLHASKDFCDGAMAYLRAGEKAKRADEENLVAQFGKVDELEQKWEKTLDEIRKNASP
jgi:rhomboid protease GluP